MAKAIKAADSITALTEKLNKITPPERRLTVQAVSQWDEVPPDRCLEVEEVTGVSRYVLRPDVFGRPPKGTQNPNKRASTDARKAA